MYYTMITVAALLFSLQFVFNDGYRKENGSSFNASLRFSLYSSVTGMVLLFIINKFQLEFSWFSLGTALVYSGVCILSGYCSIKALDTANLSVYSVFMMIGGMLLPFVYGVFCGEDMTIAKYICCALIVLSVAMTGTFGGQSKKALIYYIAIFILNGLVGVISAFHQSHSSLCVNSESFVILNKIITAVICCVLIFFSKQRNFTISRKSFALSAGYSSFNSIGNLLLLIALTKLPASVQYPIVTGGTIVFATVIDLLRKEKVSKREIFATFTAFGASVLMAF